jgi:hypothetical protein
MGAIIETYSSGFFIPFPVANDKSPNRRSLLVDVAHVILEGRMGGGGTVAYSK